MAILMILLGLAMLSFTLRHGFGVGVAAGPALHRRRRRPALDAAEAFASGEKAPGPPRELDARALFSVAYGEIASSIYFALGVLAAHALGFTPLVLLGDRPPLPDRLALVCRRHGRAPRDRRRRDVRAPRAQRRRRVPHRLGALPRLPDRDRARRALPAALPRGGAAGRGARPKPVGRDRRRRRDRARRAIVRLVRRPSLYGFGILVPALDLLTQLLLVVLGFALVFSPHALTHGMSLGTHPTWHAIAFALPLAMLAFTGLETVANLAEEARRPGVDLPRSLFGGIATVVRDLRRDRGRRRLGVPGPEHRARHPLAPRAAARRRGSDRRRAAVRARRDARVLRRRDRRADPARRGHDVDLRLLAARVLARRARPAAAELRPPQPPRARLAAGDRRGRADLVGDRDRDVVRPARRRRSSRASSRSASCSRSPPRSSR